jgi:hypothetical protein
MAKTNQPKRDQPLSTESIPIPPEDPDFEEDAAPLPQPEDVDPEGQSEVPATEAMRAEADEEPDLAYAALDFEEDGRRLVPLQHPFRRDGTPVKAIYCQRLPLGAVINLTRKSRRPQGVEKADIYAAIAGMAVEEFLGLKDIDGYAVMQAAEDFFPQGFRGDPATG